MKWRCVNLKYAHEQYNKENKRLTRILRACGAILLVLAFVLDAGTAAGNRVLNGVSATAGETAYTCGEEEHTHTPECYSDTPQCGKEASMILEDAEGETATVHAHEESCFVDPATLLICGLNEGDADENDELHSHAETCFESAEGFAAYINKENLLICGEEQTEEEETATITENAGIDENEAVDESEAIEESTAAEESEVIDETESVESEETTEITETTETGGHQHTQDCFLICGKTEHTHTVDCLVLDENAPPETKEAQQDLKPFVTDVTVTNADGTPVADNIFIVGQDYLFNIAFAESAVRQMAYQEVEINGVTGWLLYQLPPEMTVSGVAGVAHPIYGNAMPPFAIGEYYIAEDGLVAARFFEFDDKGNPLSDQGNSELVNYLDYKNVKFSFDITAKFDSKEISNEIIFGEDGKSITVTLVDPDPKLEIKKEVKQGYTYADGTIRYSITVTARDGDIKDLKVSDVTGNEYGKRTGFAGFGIFTEARQDNDGIIAFGKPGSAYPVDIKAILPPKTADDSPEIRTYTDVPWAAGGGGMLFEFDSLKKDQSITIEYTMYLETWFDYLESHPAQYPDFDPNNFKCNMNNTAVANGNSMSGKAVDEVEAKAVAPINIDIVQKGAQSMTDAEGSPRIRWGAYFGNVNGEGGTLLNGMTLVDTLGPYQKYVLDDTFVVTVTGKVTSADKDVTVKTYNASAGWSFNYISQWLEFYEGADYSSITITPEAGEFLLEEIYSIHLNYFARIEPGAPSGYAYWNDAEIIELGDKVHVEKRYGEFKVSKTAVLVGENDGVNDLSGDGEGNYAEYTVSADIPAGYQNDNIYITDYMQITYSNEASWRGSVVADQAKLQKVEVFKASTGAWEDVPSSLYAFQSPGANPDGNNENNRWAVFFGAGDATWATSKWLYDEDTTVRITYRVPLDSKISPGSQSIGEYTNEDLWLNPEVSRGEKIETIGEWLQANFLNQWVNTAQVCLGNKSVHNAKTVLTWPIVKARLGYQEETKTQWADDDGNMRFSYRVGFMNYYYGTSYTTGGNTVWGEGRQFFQPGGPAFFTDTFDAAVDFAPESFYITTENYEPNTTALYGLLTLPRDPATGKATGEGWTLELSDDGTTKTLTVDLTKLWHTYHVLSNEFTPIQPGSDSSVYPLYENWYARRNRFHVIYDLMLLKDDVAKINQGDAPLKIHNKAGFYATGNNVKQGFEDSTIVTYKKDVVNKKMEVNSNVAEIEIEINKNGIDLSADGADIITVTDTMNENLAFYQNTVKVSQWIDGHYNMKTGDWIPGRWEQLPLNVGGSDYTYTFEPQQNGDSMMELKLPNKTWLKLTYSARVTAALGETVDLENSVVVSGWSADVIKEDYKVIETSGKGGGGAQKLDLLKIDPVQEIKLKDARFALYRGNGIAQDNYTPSAGIAKTLTLYGRE
ncbi:MAG: hypothetical protein LBU77_07405, partial [Clostridiales bacterium]|nr:hypothetical protein [Clostridiales bacterium]